MNASRPPAVLFDIDGTLVDSNYLHVHAWARAFHDVGIAVDAWRIHRSIGMDGSTLVKTLSDGADDAVQERLKDLHSRYYKELTPLLRVLPGGRDVLERVASMGLQVVVLIARQGRTRKRRVEAERIREQVREDAVKVERREALADETAARARAAKAEAEAKAAEAARLEERAAAHQGDIASAREELDKQRERADSLDPAARTAHGDEPTQRVDEPSPTRREVS